MKEYEQLQLQVQSFKSMEVQVIKLEKTIQELGNSNKLRQNKINQMEAAMEKFKNQIKQDSKEVSQRQGHAPKSVWEEQILQQQGEIKALHGQIAELSEEIEQF